MIREALQSVQGGEIAAIAGMILLLSAFVAMIVWAMRLPRKHVDHMKNLPLDSDAGESSNSNDEDERDQGATHG